MTREEIMKEIERLNNRLFDIDMKDRWTTKDYDNRMMIKQQLHKLERELEG